MENLSKKEEEILDFWEKNKIYQKSLQQRTGRPVFSFYDGPPFASGLPHYGHVLASAIKDSVARYWTMRDFWVERTVGWDCHGLPVEVLVEKEIGIKNKKDILNLASGDKDKSIAKFNQECRKSVFLYIKEWQYMLKRIGRWADYSYQYATMNNEYIESVWWVWKQLYEKKLVYQDWRVTPYCPRCGTPLSNFEVNQGYKTTKVKSIYLKFKLKKQQNSYFLVWTTTPWTLSANVALAVNPNIDYLKLTTSSGNYFMARELKDSVLADSFLSKEEIIKEENIKGKQLLNLEYEPIFDFIKLDKKAYYVVPGDFVTTDEGTGIVHLAPAFGEDDMLIGKKFDLPVLITVDLDGNFKSEVSLWAGKPAIKQNERIIQYLTDEEIILKVKEIEHEYPFCWRCDSPLLYYPLNSWYVAVTKIKERLLFNNNKIALTDASGKKHQGIHWLPEYLKEGRFGKWLEGVRDWAVSRNRFWGAPIPVWICPNCHYEKVVGSISELGQQAPADLHRPYIDQVTFVCPQCGEKMKRIEDVFDCWFESGSMPYAQYHYPFENQEKFTHGFPADFIAEGLDQTRGWFYTLHVLSTALFDQPAFKNVIVNGLILDKNRKKLSKKLRNYLSPQEVFDTYGVDALRYYLLTTTSIGEDFVFDEQGLKIVSRKIILTLRNVLNFYQLYRPKAVDFKKINLLSQKNVLDKWIISCFNLLVKQVNQSMTNFDLTVSLRRIGEFINELSTWYLRRSRQQLKNKQINTQATLTWILLELSKLMAPFTPFVAEEIYQVIKDDLINYPNKESVHLENYPQVDEELIDQQLLVEMKLIRQVCELGQSVRKETQIKTRQKLSYVNVVNHQCKITKTDLWQLVIEELNIQNIEVVDQLPRGKHWQQQQANQNLSIALNIEITPDLKEEGMAREIIRKINGWRKEMKLTIKDLIYLSYKTEDLILEKTLIKYGSLIESETLSQDLHLGQIEKYEDKKEFEFEEKKIIFYFQLIKKGK
ncbi:MAG: isoleucine--tRNA ligase [Candidatus Aenigmarchaeota archaeon]|nr:isoleucine--tRNA ligase [Candidatus Aenigmarchaeota archaeon]